MRGILPWGAPLLLLLAACSHGDFPIRYERIDDLANGLLLHIDLQEAASVTGTCTGEDTGEVLRVSGESSVDPTVPVIGLLADSFYECELEAGSLTASLRVHTPSLPPEVPDTWDLVTDEVDDGTYTLFNHLVGDRSVADGRAVIVDHDGRVRWYWEYDHYGGDIDTTLGPDGQIWLGGGYGLEPTRVKLDGTVTYVAGASESGGNWHHEVQPFEDGTYEALAVQTVHDPDDADSTWTGFRIERRDPSTDTSTWSWSAQSAIEQGALPWTYSSGADAYHANAVIWGPEIDPGGVWVSLRNADRIVRIDEATGEVTWQMGPASDDFRLITADGESDTADHWFYGQHAPEMDGDVLYVHDNGSGRPGGAYSRVVAYRVDLEARTLTQIWDWTEEHWYEFIWGDVDLLPNGHVFVTQGHCPDCDDGGTTPSAFLEIDPETDEVVWELKAPTHDHMTYRAQRIDGCAIFANETYCPTE